MITLIFVNSYSHCLIGVNCLNEEKIIVGKHGDIGIEKYINEVHDIKNEIPKIENINFALDSACEAEIDLENQSIRINIITMRKYIVNNKHYILSDQEIKNYFNQLYILDMFIFSIITLFFSFSYTYFFDYKKAIAQFPSKVKAAKKYYLSSIFNYIFYIISCINTIYRTF